MLTPWLAFIESNTSGTGRLFARAATAEGFRPVLLTADATRYKYAAEDAIDVLQVDTRDQTAVLDACRKLAESSPALAGVTTSSEYFIATAAQVARSLGLPHPHPAAIRQCRDKYKQRSLLQSAGIGVPAFRSVTSVKAALSAADELGWPVVVKTVGGSGSIGVKLCADAGEAASHAAGLLRQRQNERGQPVPRRILVESVADGEEYSVETFCKTVVGITRKHLGAPPFFVEVGHDHPATLTPAADETIRRIAIDSLDALNLGWGPAHIELRLSASGAKIIEVNPRLAGGFIPELLRMSYGIDIISDTVRLAAGRPAELKKPYARYASIRFLLPDRDGTLAGLDGVDEAGRMPGVVAVEIYSRPDKRIERLGDFRDRIGHVIACGDTPEFALSAVESAHAAIRLVFQNGN